MVLAPVVRGRKGEYVDLFAELQSKGYARARVDGVVHPLTEPPKLKKQEKHTIEVVVDRLTVKASAKQRLTDSVEAALGLSGGLVLLDFVDLPEDDPQRERRFSEHLACPNDHPLAIEDLEPRVFSFNAPYGACPECTGLGTKKEVDPELIIPDPEKSLREGRDPALDRRAQPGLLPATAGGARPGPALRPRHALARASLPGAEDDPVRLRRPGARALPQQVRPRALLLHRFRGRGAVDRAPALGHRVGVVPGQVRGLHARRALRGLRWHPAQARGARRHHRRAQHRRGLQPVGGRVRRAAGAADADRPAEADRRAGAQGDQRPAALPGRRRPRLPLPGPARRHPLRRRGAAHPARHPDRVGAGRCALRARRAVDRAAPAGQPPADRDAAAAQAARQHADRGRARRGHHPHRRLDRRHRSGRRRARRPDRAQRLGEGTAGEPGVDHRGVPVRAAVDPDPGAAPAADTGPGAGGARRAGAQPAQPDRGVPARAAHRRHRRQRLGQVDAGQRHPVRGAGQPDQRRPAGPRPAHPGHRAGARGQGRRRRPVADRAYPAVEPGDLHRGLGQRPQALRRDDRGEGARLRAGPVLLQRQGRPLRGVRRRRHASRSR